MVDDIAAAGKGRKEEMIILYSLISCRDIARLCSVPFCSVLFVGPRQVWEFIIHIKSVLY